MNYFIVIKNNYSQYINGTIITKLRKVGTIPSVQNFDITYRHIYEEKHCKNHFCWAQ